MDDGKDGGHGADPGCLLDARACVGSHGFAAGVCFKNPLPISNMLPSMIELPPCPTMVLLSQDVRLGRGNDDSHGCDGIHQVRTAIYVLNSPPVNLQSDRQCRFMTKNTIVLLEMPFSCKRIFLLWVYCFNFLGLYNEQSLEESGARPSNSGSYAKPVQVH